MLPESLFRANLPLIERVIAKVCRRSGLRGADAEDFGSIVKLALIENDYAILRSFELRSSLTTFLTIVVQRLLSRERTRMWGRWNASAEAERLGPAAVLLEKLLVRDGRPIDEAVPIVCAVDPTLDRAAVLDLLARLPPRAPRPRLVPLDDLDDTFAAAAAADARAHDAETRRVSEHAGRVVRQAMAALPLQDRMLIRFHFGAGMSIADAARLLGVPQRPLYRRVEALLRMLRQTLEREGIGSAHVGDIISAAASEGVDFGLHGREDGASHTARTGDLG
ncbi:MAG TPA: sigma-70 family RNA polymerase sigma factor [Thermoanaerobaculia bacterium]